MCHECIKNKNKTMCHECIKNKNKTMCHECIAMHCNHPQVLTSFYQEGMHGGLGRRFRRKIPLFDVRLQRLRLITQGLGFMKTQSQQP
jgi:hypothetical protein